MDGVFQHGMLEPKLTCLFLELKEQKCKTDMVHIVRTMQWSTVPYELNTLQIRYYIQCHFLFISFGGDLDFFVVAEKKVIKNPCVCPKVITIETRCYKVKLVIKSLGYQLQWDQLNAYKTRLFFNLNNSYALFYICTFADYFVAKWEFRRLGPAHQVHHQPTEQVKINDDF